MSSNPATNVPSVIVVSTRGCQQCRATYRDLNKRGIEYTIDLDTLGSDHALAKKLGYMQAPVTLVRDAGTGELLSHWSGFQPGRIAGLPRGVAVAA